MENKDMKKILDEEFINQLKSIVLNLNLSLKDGNFGSNKSKAKGSSVEFTDYREYIPGDDFRRIDWNALARFGKVFIKIFMEEREAPVTLFIDKSKSMDYENKRETTLKVAATFIYCALTGYNTVSSILFDKEIVAFEKGLKGQGAFSKAISILENTEFSRESNLNEAVFKWQPRLQKGFTIIISDFMYETDLESIMKLLAYKKQKVLLCHILSNQEINPVLEGNLRLVDSENNDKIDIMAGSDAINIYHKALKDYFNNIKKICSKYNSHYLLINSNNPIEKFLKELQNMNIV